MSNEKILDAFTNIDDELIRAADVVVLPKKHTLRWVSGIAAGLALVIAIGAAPMLRGTVKPDRPVNIGDGVGNSNYHGSELSMYQKYKYAVDAGRFARYEQGRVIAQSKVGEKIEDVTVTAGWVYTNGGEYWLANEHARAEIFEILGVDADTAVAIRFLDKLEAQTTEQFYVIMNPEADLTPVQNYIIQPYDPSESDGMMEE